MSRRTPTLAVSRENDTWLVHDNATGVFGSGATRQEAEADFWQAVEGHLMVLDGEAALSVGLQEQRDRLRAYHEGSGVTSALGQP